MRIHIFGARSIPALWSGFDVTATELSKRFTAQGHDVTVFVMEKYCPPGKVRLVDGVRLVYVPTLYGKFVETPIHEFLSSIVSLFSKADVSYVLGCRSSWVYALHRLVGRIVAYNTDGLDFTRKKWGPIARWYLKLNYRIAALIGTGLIHDNTHIRSYFQEHFGRGGAFISIGGHIYSSTGDGVIQKYGLTPRSYYLIACRIEPENNIDKIVEGFRASKSTKKLVIAGGANYKSSLVESLQQIKDPRVVFLGPVYTDNHIEELHFHCFAYVHGHEVGGTNPSLLKAMGCGNIVLANGTAYNREVLGETGLFFEPTVEMTSRSIEELESTYLEHQHLRALAQDRIRRYYTWDRSAEFHTQYFSHLLGERATYGETF